MIKPIYNTQIIKIQEEPEIDIYFARTYKKPRMPVLKKSKFNISKAVKNIQNLYNKNRKFEFGKAYNEFLKEFYPYTNWAYSCWDYLLTKEGCKFLERTPFEKKLMRGHYRAFTDRDFKRLIHMVFKQSSLRYNPSIHGENYLRYFKKNFWNNIILEYKKLARPKNKNERVLTDYSYLRCIPYDFLNFHHRKLIGKILVKLPREEKEIVDLHFLRFFNADAIIERKGIDISAFEEKKKSALEQIHRKNPVAHHLLLQIERY